ncbi:Arc family DNA-binding protein [Endozoicomonas sp. YOMI1]|uniref:Arc family DNA-binding protein n=1 Tax=Endozoicomonas sp. YOMI1 TaxID=2828739 RepID=UPI0021496659|nr:Arc family DNA-binding protein [Endozoicomonas sp. YOMI1]
MDRNQTSSLPIRLPLYLRDWLQEKAEDNERSLSGEIIYRIKKDYRQEECSTLGEEEMTGEKRDTAKTVRPGH